VLIIRGERSEPSSVDYVHRGIANRSFECRLALAGHMQVRGADVKDGLLSLTLEREIPEAMKPRRIEIGGSEQNAIDSPASAEVKPRHDRVKEDA